MRFLKRYWQEIVAFLDLELFVWSATRRYWDTPKQDIARYTLDALIAFSGITLGILVWRLTKKWRKTTAHRMRELSRRWLRKVSQRVLAMLERLQQKYRRGAGDLLGGRTRVDFDMPWETLARRQRRRAWRQLESEREKLSWLYSDMVETRLKHGEFIRPADTPHMIANRESTTQPQKHMIDVYASYRYDPRRDVPQGVADELRRDLRDK